MRRLTRMAIAVLALLGADGAVARTPGWTATPDDALLLDVRLGSYQVGEGVRGYTTPEGACLIFSDIAATLDLAIAVDAERGTARGWAFEEANRVELDRRAETLRLRARPVPLGAQSIRDTPEGWCVDAPALSGWLGVTLAPDLSNAILFVRSPRKLPVELAEERKARAASIRPATAAPDPSKLPRVKLPYLMWRSPSLDAVVTVNGVRDTTRGPDRGRWGGSVRYDLFASGEVARLSVDARLASDGDGVPDSLRARAYRTDPEGGLLGPLRATHFAVGDVSGFASPLVAQSFGGRGAVVTNRPVDRPDSFDRTSFRGELPTGWDAELYRNGRLLSFARTRDDGRYEFLDVPLLYGTNRFEIVLYGPQGQIRRRVETVAVGQESIPSGKTYYRAGFSEDDRDLVRLRGPPDTQGRGWRGTLGVEHGVDPKTSLFAQLHTLMARNERLTYVEGAVRRAVGPALIELSAAYEAGEGIAARAQMIGQFGQTYVSVESIKAFGRFRSDRIEPDVTGRHILAIDHAFVFGTSSFPTHAEARWIERRDGLSTLEAGARVSANVRNLSLTAGLDWQGQRARGRDPPPDRVTAALLANGRVGRVRVRGEARYRVSGDSQGFEGATVVGEWGASDVSQWRAELGYDGISRRGRGAIGYSRRFDRFAVGLTGEAATDGSVAAGLNLALSVGPSPRGGVRVTSSKLGSGGTAIARVFRDLNEDGVRQDGEPFERGVQMTASQSVIGALTDARGEVVIDGLTPFRPITIGVDTSSLADPLVQPKTSGQRIVPRPGIAFRVDMPLVGAGEIEGTLVSDATGVEGVDIELVDARGAVAATQRSDFDGYFLFEAVPYGRYTLRLAQLSADAARLNAALGTSAIVGSANPTLRLGPVNAAATAGTRSAAK